jgi:hypothetical protein
VSKSEKRQQSEYSLIITPNLEQTMITSKGPGDFITDIGKGEFTPGERYMAIKGVSGDDWLGVTGNLKIKKIIKRTGTLQLMVPISLIVSKATAGTGLVQLLSAFAALSAYASADAVTVPQLQHSGNKR